MLFVLLLITSFSIYSAQEEVKSESPSLSPDLVDGIQAYNAKELTNNDDVTSLVSKMNLTTPPPSQKELHQKVKQRNRKMYNKITPFPYARPLDLSATEQITEDSNQSVVSCNQASSNQTSNAMEDEW